MKKLEKIEGVVAPEIVAYAEAHSTKPSVERRRIKKETERRLGKDAEMQLGFTGGNFLALLAEISHAVFVLEVGTLTGGTTLAIAEQLPSGGRITTIERDENVLAIAEKHWAKSRHKTKINSLRGDAEAVLKNLQDGRPYDMAFIDANKEAYARYWDLVLPLVRIGGMIIVDDVLCDGEIIDPKSDKVKTMARFNRKVARDKRVKTLLLPTLDGLILARKK